MKSKITLAALTVLASASVASALDIYLDRPSWEAALGGATPVVEDFDDVTPFAFADGQTLTTSKLSVTRDGSQNAGDGVLEIVDGSAFGNIDGTNFLDGETGIEPHETVVVEFLGQSAFAFGADWFSPFSGDGIGLEIDGELVLLDSIQGFDIGFVGVVSDTPFQAANIVGTPDAISFQELWSADNLSYAVIPEPSALSLLLVGIIALVRRRG